MESKGKIIVTGGAGYIGSHTVVELINQQYTPIIIDDFSNSSEDVITRIQSITGIHVKTYKLNCNHYGALKSVAHIEGNIEGVIHFAAFKSVSESIKQPIKYYQNNINSLLNMIRLTKEFNIPKFIFSSSCTVYGEPINIPVDENEPLQNPKSPYGQTKLMGEQIIQNSLSKGYVILRYFNPIGAHPSGLIGELPNGIPENLLPYVTQTAIGKRDYLHVYGADYNTFDGTCIRDYVHVVDLALAHVKSLDYLSENTKSQEIFNVGTGKGTSVLELIKLFEKVSNMKIKYSIENRRAGDIEQIYANCDKIKNMMNWESNYSIEDALMDSWRWETNNFKSQKAA